jgi:hypothetical protein
MLRLFPSQLLPFLAQFDSFLDTVRYYMYKYAENKVMALVYTAGCLIIVVFLYQLMARKK